MYAITGSYIFKLGFFSTLKSHRVRYVQSLKGGTVGHNSSKKHTKNVLRRQKHNRTMAKTYPLKALWPLLPFEVAGAPLLATLETYGSGLLKYAVTQDGIGFFRLRNGSPCMNLRT
ncbi:MAG: hypothetical protein QE265_11920 [Rhodoferax sp.]|nr:hypothetical protein [Rhodoferax sp.]